MKRALLTELRCVKEAHRRRKQWQLPRRNTETLLEHAEKELQNPKLSWVEIGKGCEGQQERLLVHMPGNSDQCQPQSSDHPASLLWWGRFKVKPRNQVSRSGSWRYETGHWHSCSTAVVWLRQRPSARASAWKQLPRDGGAGRALLRLPLAFFLTSSLDQQKVWPWTQSTKLLNQLKCWKGEFTQGPDAIQAGDSLPPNHYCRTKPGAPGGQRAACESATCPCSKKQANCTRGSIGKRTVSCRREVISPSVCLLCPILGSPSQERHRYTEASPVECCQDFGWLELLMKEERLRELRLLGPKERCLQGEPPCCMQLPREGCREDGARLLSEVHNGRKRGSKDELGHEKFWLDRVIYLLL